MTRVRGHRGSVRTLGEHIASVRPAPKREAFLRVEALIGEQAQVDWAHVGRSKVEGGVRSLWAELLVDLTAVSLCRSLVPAATALGGCTRQWLFDNPNTVVLELHGDAVRVHPALVGSAGTRHVQPRLCAVRRPQQRGKVERSIRTCAMASSTAALSPTSRRAIES